MSNKGYFKKGHTPWNKGLKGIHLSPNTEFKKGIENTGNNHKSWKGGVQKPKNDCVYLWSGNKKRIRRPRAIYEEHYGPIPKGYVVIHIDGNRYNDKPENLKAISRAENMKRNARKSKTKAYASKGK